MTRKRLLTLTLTLTILISISFVFVDFAKGETKTLDVVLDYNYPPYIFLDGEGLPHGILVDQWKLFEEKTGVTVRLHPMAWGDAQTAMKDGKYDVIDTIFYSKARDEIYDFTKRYETISTAIFFQADIGGITDIDSLKGFSVGAKEGDYAIDKLIEAGVKDIQTYSSYEDMVKAASQGELKIFIMDIPPALYYLNKYEIDKDYNYSDPVYSEGFHRAVLGGDVATLTLINNGFEKISSSENKAINNQWLGNQVVLANYFPQFMLGLGIVIVIIIGMLIWTNTLKRRVKSKTADLSAALDIIREDRASLKTQINLFESLLKVLPIGVFMVDAESGKPLIVNETAKGLLGRGIVSDSNMDNLAEVYGAYRYGTNEPYPTNEMPIIRGMRGESCQVDDMIVREPDGKERLLEVLGAPISDSDGKIWASLVAFTDITQRKQFETQIRESEEKFQMLFEKAPLGYQSLDIEGNFLEVNQKWLDIFGYQKNEVIGKWFGDFLAPGYQEAFRNRFPLFKEQGYIHSEFEMLGKTGEKMYIAFDGKIGHSNDGTFQQTHCILKDITMERLLTRELAESRKLMEAIIENTTDAIYVKDLQGKYILVNRTVEEVVGKSKAELIGQDDYFLFPPEEAKSIMEADQGICASGITKTFEEFATDASGIVNTFLSTKGPILDEKNQVSGLFGIARNITERKLLEQQIQQDQKLLQATLISVGDGVITSDIRGMVQFMNPVAERLTGWTQQDAKGKQIEEIFQIFNELTGEKSDSITKLVFETGSIVGLANHTVLQSRNGERKPIEDSAAPIIMEDGEIIGVVVVFSDFTEKRNKMNEIEYLSYHDALTGLYNRRFFEEEIKRHDVARNMPITIVMGDINGLKLMNDSFGHATGDELLKRAAELITHACREDDIVARLGGDEFVLLLPRSEKSDAEGMIKRIRETLAEEKIEGIPISVSFGLATKNKAEQSMATVLKEAEDHMYKHKIYERTGAKSSTVNLILSTLYAKNHREMLHSQRVGAIAGSIAMAMGYSDDDVNQIKTAGLMHDIGKIGIEDNILNKFETLNAQEWDEIKKHSEIGYRILSSVPEFIEISVFVLQHHERWDGNGYPRGLKGEEISKEAQIIAVADSFDAMTGERTYGTVFSTEEAMQELLRCAGTQFNPEIVEIFAQNLFLNVKDEDRQDDDRG